MNNNQMYIGFAPDLKARIYKHKTGKVFSTKKYLPIVLTYYECYLSKEDALRQERMLKQYGSSWSQLKKRINKSFSTAGKGRIY